MYMKFIIIINFICTTNNRRAFKVGVVGLVGVVDLVGVVIIFIHIYTYLFNFCCNGYNLL